MGAKPWATDEQSAYLHTLMPDYVRRQAEGKLHLFWPPMTAGFFERWPEHAALNLPLPSDPTARKLTDNELVTLGAALKTRIKQLEGWFRYQRKKISRAADGGSSGSGGSAAALRTLFGLNVKRTRAPQAIERFQKRNVDLVNDALEEAGYNTISAVDDDPDDFTDESEDTPAARAKANKSLRLRTRTRVVQALWAEASDEERQGCNQEVAAEKERMRAEELTEEKQEKTPAAFQAAIDAVEGVYGDIHEATFKATGWVGMTILGGPNPRMDGELSLKMRVFLFGTRERKLTNPGFHSVCFGENSAGADFEQSCLNFDEDVVEPFEAFVRMCYTAAECKARALPQVLPSTTTTEPPPRVLRVVPAPIAVADPSSKTKKKSKKNKKSTEAKKSTATAATTISVSTVVPAPPTTTLDASMSPSIEAHPDNEGADSDPQGDVNMEMYPASPALNPSSLDNSKLFTFDDFDNAGLVGMDATAAPLDFDFDSFPASPALSFSLSPIPSPQRSDLMSAPLNPPSMAEAGLSDTTDAMGGPNASAHPNVPALSYTRPLPRPLFALRSTVGAEATVNVGGFNFPVDAPKSSPWSKTVLFECFRAPGTTAASSTTTTPTTAASSTITPAAASSTTTTASSSVADTLAAAAETATFSPRKGVSYSQWRQRSGAKAATPSGVVATGAPTVSPTGAAATGAPTKAAQFLSELLQQSSTPAPPLSAATAPVPAVPGVTPQVDDEGDGVWAPVLPATRPPTNAAPAPATKADPKKTPARKSAPAAAKKPAAAASAGKKEAAAKAAQKVSAVAGSVKRGAGRPPKVHTPPLADTTNAELQAPVVGRYRAPVDHAAINFRRRSREAAEREKAAEKAAAEKEAADKRAAEIERGWAERVVEGTRTLTRVRKAPKHADGTEVHTKSKKSSAPVGTATSTKSRSWADASTTRAAAAASAKLGTKRQAATQLTSGVRQKK
ncbi:hypothetical protein B0H16DRAFT_1732010 [Mycena metata]|uniref:Uncharacterized protein n=1 Tax=Mycena metata TaxID=1033252 RepID=A0AAD7MVJ3_9AGAR|nr:hypothetical protein B0H16DRAFT_1732010 [Mycena metata]